MSTERALYWEAHDKKKGITYNHLDKSTLAVKISRKKLSSADMKSTANYWFKTCNGMFKEFLRFRTQNSSTEVSPPTNVLDLCCAPGGFMKAMLDRYPSIRHVVGVTLPSNSGGLPMLFKHRNASVIFRDLRDEEPSVVAGDTAGGSRWLLDVAGSPDFVIIDGCWWTTNNANDNTESDTNGKSGKRKRGNDGGNPENLEIHYSIQQLDMALLQLQLGLSALAIGGEMFIRANDPQKGVWGYVYYLLANVFDKVELFRPSLPNDQKLRTRSFLFYHCTGLASSESLRVLTSTIHELRTELRVCIHDRRLSDVDRLLTAKILCTEDHRQTLARKMERVWNARASMFSSMRKSME
eukprot:6725138-Pyramimonas_sp.AAC.1